MRTSTRSSLAAILLGASLLGGCAQKYERLIDKSSRVRPSWIRITPPSSDGQEFFVGRTLAVNVLDERRAMLRARHDAAYSIAMSIVTEVRGNSRLVDSQWGDEVRGEEELDVFWQSQIDILVNQILSGFRYLESYWELWEVTDAPPGRQPQTFRRYKYYVLVSFPQAELARCREEVKKNARTSLTGSTAERPMPESRAGMIRP